MKLLPALLLFLVFCTGTAGAGAEQQINERLKAGGTVYLSAGSYEIEGPIIIGSDTILTGDKDAIIKVSSSSSQWFTGSTGIISCEESVKNVEIYGFSMTSTSPQTGLSTYSANAPKTLRKVKDKAYGGITLQSFGMAVVWVFVSMVFILPLAFFESWIVECFVIALVICWWLLYVKFVATENKLEESFLFIKFFFDGYSGLHTVAKYDIDIKFLESVFPLVNIHSDGLIEFKDQTFGILIKFFPERVNEEDIETHGMRMQEVIDGLAGDTSIKFIASSKHDLRKPILDRLLEAMNKKNTSPKIYEYLHSLYEMIENKKQENIEWSFFIFFGLGKFDNLQDAQDQMDSEYPGLVDSLNEAGITVLKLTDRIEIAKEYRQMVLPVVI